MTRDELMKKAAEKAVAENSWESIEFLFQPSTMLELLLRNDFEGTRRLVAECAEWITDSPDFRRVRRAIEVEEFFRKLKEVSGRS